MSQNQDEQEFLRQVLEFKQNIQIPHYFVLAKQTEGEQFKIE